MFFFKKIFSIFRNIHLIYLDNNGYKMIFIGDLPSIIDIFFEKLYLFKINNR